MLPLLDRWYKTPCFLPNGKPVEIWIGTYDDKKLYISDDTTIDTYRITHTNLSRTFINNTIKKSGIKLTNPICIVDIKRLEYKLPIKSGNYIDMKEYYNSISIFISKLSEICSYLWYYSHKENYKHKICHNHRGLLIDSEDMEIIGDIYELLEKFSPYKAEIYDEYNPMFDSYHEKLNIDGTYMNNNSTMDVTLHCRGISDFDIGEIRPFIGGIDFSNVLDYAIEYSKISNTIEIKRSLTRNTLHGEKLKVSINGSEYVVPLTTQNKKGN